MPQSTLGGIIPCLLLALGATPACAANYQVVVFSCAPSNCQVVHTQLAGNGGSKASYHQDDLAIEIEPLASGTDSIDARVSLHLRQARPLKAAIIKGSQAIAADMNSMVRISTLNSRFFSQLLNYTSGGHSYLVWGRLGHD